MSSMPKNWPSPLPYFTSPHHAKGLTESQLLALRTRPDSVPSIPASSTLTPCPLVKIQPIRDPSHPANGQYGLFATRDLKPGEFVLAYLGTVHGGSAAESRPDSDYDLWIDREADAAVDAAAGGNEGRFVNDYRGIGSRANCEFRAVWAERWGEVCIGIWVIGGGKKGTSKGRDKGEGGSKGKKKDDGGSKGKKKSDGGIRKGEEMLVSYGKGFWGERALDEGGGEGEGEGEGEMG